MIQEGLGKAEEKPVLEGHLLQKTSEGEMQLPLERFGWWGEGTGNSYGSSK